MCPVSGVSCPSTLLNISLVHLLLNHFGCNFQRDQVTVGSSINLTLDDRFKPGGVMIKLFLCIEQARPPPIAILLLYVYVCVYSVVLVGLGVQGVRDGLAVVEISRSSFRRFFFARYATLLRCCADI